MSRVHDMGGRYGDGLVAPNADEPVFAADWHRRALGLTLAAGALGAWNIDASRHAREALRPQDYARFGYYEKWLAALADLLVATGLVTREELAGEDVPAPQGTARALRPGEVPDVLARGAPTARDGPSSAFAVGDLVRTRLPARNVLVAGGHTRLPGYAAGQTGRIATLHGPHVLPDSNAHFLGEAPEPLYTVAFDAADLWGTAERQGDTVTADLWESYLERPA